MNSQTRDRVLIGGGLVVIVMALAWIILPSLFGGWQQGCTLIGCLNSLDVVVGDARVLPGDYEAEVCLDGACQTVAVTVTVNAFGASFRAEGLTGSPPGNRDVEVSVRLLEDGVMVSESSGPVRFRLDRPNGPRCDPVCFIGSLVV